MDNKRSTGFLLGLIVALSLCLAALEFTSHPKDGDDEAELFDDIVQDLEQLPALDQKDMVAAVSPPETKPSVSEQLREVKEAKTPDEIQKPDVVLTNEGSGITVAEVVEETNQQNTTALPPVPVDEEENPLNWRVVEQLPEYPGGIVEFMKWLTKNLKYPPTAKAQKMQGKVVVQFVVNKDGSITDAKVVSPKYAPLDAEAMRVIRMMPKWTPGKMDGKVCRTLFAIPIVFQL